LTGKGLCTSSSSLHLVAALAAVAAGAGTKFRSNPFTVDPEPDGADDAVSDTESPSQ
jgi:hypothetical protein